MSAPHLFMSAGTDTNRCRKWTVMERMSNLGVCFNHFLLAPYFLLLAPVALHSIQLVLRHKSSHHTRTPAKPNMTLES
jgi:hypothetical protein